jgi:hypothetical protein
MALTGYIESPKIILLTVTLTKPHMRHSMLKSCILCKKFCGPPRSSLSDVVIKQLYILLAKTPIFAHRFEETRKAGKLEPDFMKETTSNN